MSDLVVQARSTPKYYEIGVAISDPDEPGEVYEGYRSFDAKSEKQAVMEAYKNYEDDEWDVERLRYIKKVYRNDE